MLSAGLRAAALVLCLSAACRGQVSPSPSPSFFAALPVDSYADFACGSQPARGGLFWGKYNVSGVWSPFSTCDLTNPRSTGTPTWWEPATSGSYCLLRNNGGQANAAVACSGSAWGDCTPALRWVSDRGYGTVMATASFCAGGGCGSIVVATLGYRTARGAPKVTLFAANT